MCTEVNCSALGRRPSWSPVGPSCGRRELLNSDGIVVGQLAGSYTRCLTVCVWKFCDSDGCGGLGERQLRSGVPAGHSGVIDGKWWFLSWCWSPLSKSADVVSRP